MRQKPYVMLYTDKHGVRGQWYGHSPQILALQGEGMIRWAVYRTTYHGQDFHNSTDKRYLVRHDDPYWHNRERRENHGVAT